MDDGTGGNRSIRGYLQIVHARKAHHAQYAQWVIGKGVANMANHPRLQIGESIIGVMELPRTIYGECIHGKVARRGGCVQVVEWRNTDVKPLVIDANTNQRFVTVNQERLGKKRHQLRPYVRSVVCDYFDVNVERRFTSHHITYRPTDNAPWELLCIQDLRDHVHMGKEHINIGWLWGLVAQLHHKKSLSQSTYFNNYISCYTLIVRLIPNHANSMLPTSTISMCSAGHV